VAKYKARFFHDWGSGTWLWAANDLTRSKYDYAVDHHRLGFADQLAADLDELTARRDKALNWDYPPHPGPWREPECAAMNAAVAVALTLVRNALGSDWEIIDESQPLHEDPDLDRYQGDPKGFRR
jgi:hypothetical protein